MKMADFSGMQAEVERNRSVVGSAVALINGIAAKIDAAVAANDASDNTQLTDLANSLRSDSDSLAAAVGANTPAETGGAPGTGEPTP
jgi:hypothetical protein